MTNNQFSFKELLAQRKANGITVQKASNKPTSKGRKGKGIFEGKRGKFWLDFSKLALGEYLILNPTKELSEHYDMRRRYQNRELIPFDQLANDAIKLINNDLITKCDDDGNEIKSKYHAFKNSIDFFVMDNIDENNELLEPTIIVFRVGEDNNEEDILDVDVLANELLGIDTDED